MSRLLLAWGDALFLLSWELKELQIQRVVVDAEEKKASLCLLKVKDDGAAAVLPADARLVAANEVEDTELATYYPVLVFRASTSTADNSLATRKRRRFRKDKEALTAAPDDDMEDLLSSRSGDRVFFCRLYETEDDSEIGLRFLNMLEIPARTGARRGEVDAVARKYSNSLQVFLTDGPHVLLFQRSSQLTTVLRLRKTTRGDCGDFGFYVWREIVDVVHAMKDDAVAPCELVSCVYVSETHSTRPHLLIHAKGLSRSSSADSEENHIWSILNLDGIDGATKETSSQCHYLHSITGWNAAISKLEQVICCCFISELTEWDFKASASSDAIALTSWDNRPSTQSSRTNVRMSTLVLTGTTSNTIYMHANGIVLVSYVLPARPAEMWFICENNLNQHHVLCVRCDDENRSFFMLRVSSNVQNVSMELLLAFNHVGHAYTGYLAGTHTVDASTPGQVLLLNDVPGVSNTRTYSIENELSTDKSVDDRQLVKRSVLITQKASASELKLSCHRLRLREKKKSKHSSRSRKRSRNDEKNSSKDESAGSRTELFHYIERTQKASLRDKSLKVLEANVGVDNSAASQSQLDKLAESLSIRLMNGLQELERLQMIVADKYSLARQLNQLIALQWQEQHTRASHNNEHSVVPPLRSTQNVDNLCSAPNYLLDMETLVNAPPRVSTIPRNAAKYEATEREPASSLGNLEFHGQISLEQFRVLEYVPPSSLVHAEVVLKNVSHSTLHDTFVVLTLPKGTPTHGWRCSSSVVPKFPSATDMADHTPQTARFQLELHFTPKFSFLRERKPFEATLWLHYGASRDEIVSEMNHDWRPCESAFAVAYVKIHPDDVLDVGRESLTKSGGDCHGRSYENQEQLLFISSGSNLGALFGNQSFGISTSADSVIRPTFALTRLNVRSRELMLYKLSRMVASLPSDVYVMHNPFQHTHLRALQLVLRSMRQEILASQQHSNEKPRKQAKERDSASIQRSLQRDTDFQANRMLQGLQKRVNFHTMWFDVTT